MLSLTHIAAVACLCAIPVRGADATQRGKDIKYFAYFGEKVLKRSDRIALVKVAKVTPGAPGTEVVRLQVEEVLKGDHARTEELVLASRGDFFADVEMLIFLEPYGQGRFTTYVGRILRVDPDFTAKLRVLKQYLELERLADDAARAEQVRQIILKNLTDASDWVRWNALRELDHVARLSSGLLTAGDQRELATLQAASREGTFKKALGEVLGRLVAGKKP